MMARASATRATIAEHRSRTAGRASIRAERTSPVTAARRSLTGCELEGYVSNAATVARITKAAISAAPSNGVASPSPVICQTMTDVPRSAPV